MIERQIGRILQALLMISIALAVCTVITLLTSCGSTRIVTEVRDSTVIKTVYVPDTVYIDIPAQASERTTADSTSHLENDYAKSDARINADGSLFHSLETRPQQKPVEIQKKIEYRYRTIIKTVKDTEYIEKELSWWERFRLHLCNIFFISIAVFVITALYKRREFLSGLFGKI